jgi:hypothetical protein
MYTEEKEEGDEKEEEMKKKRKSITRNLIFVCGTHFC